MSTGLAIPVPLTDRQVTVNFEHRTTVVHPAHDEDDLEDVVAWIAYFDEEDRTARAVAPELSLVVERPTVRAAVDELQTLVRDYLADAQARGESRSDLLRLLPKDIFATHMTRLTKMIQRHIRETGTAWAVGHCHLSDAQVPASTT